MASTEELGYKWKRIKRIPVNTIWSKLECRNIICLVKNISTFPIYLMFTDPNEFDVHHEWNNFVSAEDDHITLMPGQMIGPLFLSDVYIKSLHAPAHLQIIERELR